MATNLKNKLQHEIFEKVAEAAKNLSLESYVVGGYVRDLILKRSSVPATFVTESATIVLIRLLTFLHCLLSVLLHSQL